MAAIGIMSYPSRDGFSGYPQQYPYHGRSASDTRQEPQFSTHASSSSNSPTSEESRPSLPSISNLLGIANRSPDLTRSPESSKSNSKEPQLDHPSYRETQRLANSPLASRLDAPALASPTFKPDPTHPQYTNQPAPYDMGAYAARAYVASPGSISDGSNYSPTMAVAHHGYNQQPIPPVYAPNTIPVASHSTPNLPATNPWEHHHYIVNSSGQQGAYNQMVAERYVCNVCSKAFSRPSSLKIHQHSHTGEKPFLCPEPGCGKAFSVKSNMIRHKRCHGEGQSRSGADMMEE